MEVEIERGPGTMIEVTEEDDDEMVDVFSLERMFLGRLVDV